jgi:hypothetical protein
MLVFDNKPVLENSLVFVREREAVNALDTLNLLLASNALDCDNIEVLLKTFDFRTLTSEGENESDPESWLDFENTLEPDSTRERVNDLEMEKNLD